MTVQRDYVVRCDHGLPRCRLRFPALGKKNHRYTQRECVAVDAISNHWAMDPDGSFTCPPCAAQLEKKKS